MHTIDCNSSVPLYHQVRELILSDIHNGIVKNGEKLPSEIILAQKYGVSRITIRKALEALETDKIVIRKQGKGTFVATPETLCRCDNPIGFTKAWTLLGKTPATRVIKLELSVPPKEVRDFLGSKDDEPVICSKRLRFVDDHPVCIETNYYSHNLNFVLSEDLNGSLYDSLVGRHNLTLQYRSRILNLCRATREESELLQIEEGSPLILFKDQFVDPSGSALFYSLQLYNIDNIDLYLH